MITLIIEIFAMALVLGLATIAIGILVGIAKKINEMPICMDKDGNPVHDKQIIENAKNAINKKRTPKH